MTRFTDYYQIDALGDSYIVAFSTALTVERQLEECAITDWIEFTDVFDATHRVPAGFIHRITESPRGRASLRAGETAVA